ncbi:MAG: DNA recombination protein RmuC [Gammaproteobacteria bacterium]|nr:DNA recombination protein RmuC [Gammaproteobacteria bacterium]
MRLSSEFGQIEQDQLRQIGLLRQELNHRSALCQQQQTQLQQRQQEHRLLQGEFSEAQKQLASSRQSLTRLHELEQEVVRREQDYKQLLAEHKGLEARAASEKQALEEKLVLLRETREQLNGEFQLLANKIFADKQSQFAEQSRHSLNASVEPLKTQIEAFRKKVEDAYDKESAERNQLVGQIAELQKQTRQIGEDAINLTNALKGDSKVQGNWGEVILERLLEQSGLQKGREYQVQVALKDEHGRRRNPDVIVRLPEQKDIVIDSKVSLLHYEQFMNAAEKAEQERLLKLHLGSLRAHIQQLSSKSYEKLEGIRSLDFVFLFVPIEAAFMVALQADQSLFQEAYEKQIILVSPTTLLAMLRTVENIWRYEKQNRNAEEIARQAGGLHDQFARLLEAMNEVGRQIQKTGDAYDLARKRLVDGNGNLVKRVDGLRKLGAKTKKQFPPGMLPESEVALLEDES